MPSVRRSALVLLAAVLTGCTTQAAPDDEAPPAADGPQAEQELLPQLDDDDTILTAAVDGAGEPVLLVAPTPDGHSELQLLRRTGDEWATTTLTDQNSLNHSGDLHVTADGTLVVTGFADDRYAVTRIAPDGTTSTVPVATERDLGATRFLESAVAPAGDVVYVSFEDTPGGADTLLAVDAATGAVRAEQTLLAESGTREAAALAVAPSGEPLVGWNDNLDGSGSSEVTTLVRYDAGLRVVADVPLVDDGAPSDVRQIAVGRDGTVYVTVGVGTDDENTYVGVHVFRVLAGASAASEFVSWVDSPRVDDLGVDPDGEHLHLLGLTNGSELGDRTLTTVDLATGEAEDPISLCVSLTIGHIAVAPGGEVFATTTCYGDDFVPSLHTLG